MCMYVYICIYIRILNPLLENPHALVCPPLSCPGAPPSSGCVAQASKAPPAEFVLTSGIRILIIIIIIITTTTTTTMIAI